MCFYTSNDTGGLCAEILGFLTFRARVWNFSLRFVAVFRIIGVRLADTACDSEEPCMRLISACADMPSPELVGWADMLL